MKKKKNKIYKIKDLPKNFNMVGCYLGNEKIISGWNKGFWLGKENSQRITPIFFKDFDIIKNWKIVVPLERSLEIEVNKLKKLNE